MIHCKNRGVTGSDFQLKVVFLSLKICFILANSEDPNRGISSESSLFAKVQIKESLVPRWYFFCGSFMFFCHVFVMPLHTSVYLYLVVTYWERAGLLALVCGVSL